nr:glycosyltransferase family 4 protein [Arthrobacter gengyunqii]
MSKIGPVARLLPRQLLLRSLLSLVAGDQKELQAQLTAAQNKPDTRSAHKVRLANIALAAGLPDAASSLLSGASPTKASVAPSIARLRWYNGDMQGAVEALKDISGRRALHMRNRLESERQVFHGWQPSLSSVEGYKPTAETVLHVLTNSLPHTGSGYAQRSHSVLKAQRQSGWNVHAVTRPGYPVQLGMFAARSSDVIDDVVYHRILPATLPEGMAARLQYQAEQTLQLALTVRPSVLHTTTHFVNAVVTAAVAEALGIPWVYEVRGQLADTWASPRGAEARTSERYLAFVARESEATLRADQCATLGSEMKSAIIVRESDGPEIELLPNGVGEAFLDAPMKAMAARQRLGLPVEGVFVGTVSSLVDYEGLDDLIGAFAELAKSNDALMCLIVGGGAAEASLRQQAKESGFTHRIIFTGRVDRKLAHLYHQALDIFVVPRKDSHVTRSVTPLKPVEALASSRPVVFSALPALQETIRDGVEGIAVEPSNRSELAGALGSLAEDARLRHRMGAAGRERILAERTWTAVAFQTTVMYERLKVSQ